MPGVLRRPDVRRPADRREELRPGDPGHPGPRPRQGPPPRRAGRPRRRRPPGDRAPRRRQDQGRVRASCRSSPTRPPRPRPDAILVHEGRDDHHFGHVPHPNIVHRQPIVRGDVDEAARARRRHRQGRVHLRHAGPGLPRPRVRPRGARRGRRRRPVRRHPVAALRPAPDRARPRPARGQGPDDAVRRRRRVRRPRGPVDADPRLPAGAAHRQARQDRLQPLRVLLRPRPPPPGEAHLRARRHQGRQAHPHEGADRPGRRRVRLRLPGGRRQRRLARRRPVRRRRRRHRGDRPLHQQPALRRDARLRRGPGVLRLRGPDGQARRRSWAWTRSSSASSTPWSRARSCRPARPSTRPAPVAELLRRVKAMPAAARAAVADGRRGARTYAQLPGGLSNTTHGEGVVRGVGYAVGIKNVGFSEGFDDYSTARVRMEVIGGEPVATVHTAMAEVGQGGVTVHAQIARTELGVAQVTIQPADTQVGSAGSTSASRQTYVTGGAVKNSCEAGPREGPGDRPPQVRLVPPGVGHRRTAPGGRQGRHRRRRGPRRPGRRARRRGRRRRGWSGGTGRPSPSTCAPARATATSSTPSPRTARSSRSTPNSAWSRSSNWPAPRTSARRSTRCPSSARSRAAPPRAWASR